MTDVKEEENQRRRELPCALARGLKILWVDGFSQKEPGILLAKASSFYHQQHHALKRMAIDNQSFPKGTGF
jgi:hypothetical protein